MRLQPGTRLEVTVDRLSLGGEGVARAEGVVIFVPYSAPGDRLEVEITEMQNRFARAWPLRVITSSKDRIEAPCPYHFQIRQPEKPACGGCSWQHLAYETQKTAKQELVRETFERIGGLKGVQVRSTLGMKEPWRYRNKVQQPVGWRAGEGLITGFYAEGSHDIVPIDDCLVQPELSVALINHVREFLKSTGVRAYQSEKHDGWIRHLLVRTNREEEALLVFVTRTPDFPHEGKLLSALVEAFPSLVGVFQNVNPGRTNVILGRDWRHLGGDEALEERLGKLRFGISPASFFQINTEQTEVLYGVAADFAGKGQRLLDLYCGAGGIALWLADKFEQVGGVEENARAIDDAEANAKLNGITNTVFQDARTEDFLRGLHRSAGGPGLTVTLDPPRAGMEPAALRALADLKPGKIVYVSCDPGTLARDLAGLVKGGYRIGRVQPVDLFPQTPHIETVVELLSESRGRS